MKFVDRLAKLIITIGGQGVIAAVLGILLFLGASVLPLFEGGEVGPVAVVKMGEPTRPLFGQTDEYRGTAMIIGDDGFVSTVYIPDGRIIDRQRFAVEGRTPTCWSFSRQQSRLAIGYDDGSVQIGTIRFESESLGPEDRTPEINRLAVGQKMVFGNGYVEHAAAEQFRLVRPIVEPGQPAMMEHGTGAVVKIDSRSGGESDYLVATRADGSGVFSLVRTVRPLGGGTARVSLSSTPFTMVPPAGKGGGGGEDGADWVFVTGDAAHIFMIWKDGTAQRYAIVKSSQGDEVVAADTTRLIRPGETITAAQMILGSRTLIVGTDKGRVIGAFAARDEGMATPDYHHLVIAHEYALGVAGGSTASGAGAITSIGISQRDRSFVVGDDRGGVFVLNMTSGKAIAEMPGAGDATARATSIVEIAPKLDGVLAVSDSGEIRTWEFDPKHAEAGVRSLFGKVWYEGEPAPSWNYQSSSGEDSAEPKLSLTPLIFGTLKSTIYAMLFAVPLAILAAIYTSEMLHPTVRNRVKPVVEAMASLPSVVLGFIAALIVAPFARDWLPSILIGLFVVPFGALLAAHIWQMLPIRVASRLRSGQHFALVTLVLFVGLAASALLGPIVERVLFRPTEADVLVLAGSFEPVPKREWPAWIGSRPTLSPDDGRRLRTEGLAFRDGQVVRPSGSITDAKVQAAVQSDGVDKADVRLWLDGVIGGPWPGWFLLMLMPGYAAALVLRVRLIDPALRRYPSLIFGSFAAKAELAKFLGVLIFAIGLSAVFATVLTGIGVDARDSIFGPFNQRNSLVVGIIMGFAIIPIIYTVSEDALSSVPQQLRSASLGAGATRWQTAVRVVLPVAASGIFSACMIGLGRAAGETMIVLMATGNTPSMDWSMFSGFRTLAANIAVELPEAARDSTHYRVLFLCGLVLFFLTGIVNTLAELVRQRFRKRTAGL